jgi:hypothetical protein
MASPSAHARLRTETSAEQRRHITLKSLCVLLVLRLFIKQKEKLIEHTILTVLILYCTLASVCAGLTDYYTIIIVNIFRCFKQLLYKHFILC